MSKEELEAAISGIETWVRTIDSWVLIFSAAVVLGVAGELWAAVAHWRADVRLRPLRLEQSRIHDLELKSLETASKEATARALEAQLALEKFRTPRRLTAEQKLSVSNRMRPFSGATFAIASSGGEAVPFAIDIADTLILAGWQWINWPLGGIAVKPPNGRPEIGLDVMQGIETHIFDDSLKPLAGELFQALAEVGYKNMWIVLPVARAGHEKTVIIIIGTKE